MPLYAAVIIPATRRAWPEIVITSPRITMVQVQELCLNEGKNVASKRYSEIAKIIAIWYSRE
jgi:hypothetical protein